MSGMTVAVGLTLALALALELSACKSTPAERPAELEEPALERVEPPPAAEKPLEAVPAADDGESPSAVQLPVAEDFQAETATAIGRANYRSELDALEGELRADVN